MNIHYIITLHTTVTNCGLGATVHMTSMSGSSAVMQPTAAKQHLTVEYALAKGALTRGWHMTCWINWVAYNTMQWRLMPYQNAMNMQEKWSMSANMHGMCCWPLPTRYSLRCKESSMSASWTPEATAVMTV
jgi:hypothetical protein